MFPQQRTRTSLTRIVSSAALVCALSLSGLAHAQDTSAGERLFRQRCGACHTVQPGQNRIGPHLHGIFGRKPASVEGARYSEGMRSRDQAWDAAQLDAYLASPRTVVPGTTMTVAVPGAPDRASIVAYLQTLGSAQ